MTHAFAQDKVHTCCGLFINVATLPAGFLLDRRLPEADVVVEETQPYDCLDCRTHAEQTKLIEAEIQKVIEDTGLTEGIAVFDPKAGKYVAINIDDLGSP